MRIVFQALSNLFHFFSNQGIMLPSKSKNLSRCSKKIIHFCKNYHLHQTADRANILCKYTIYIFFFNFWRGFSGFYSVLFLKTPASCGKNVLKQFLLHCTSVLAQKVFQIFKILFQTEDINIFAVLGVLSSRYVQLKSPFLTKKISAVKSETYFSREAIGN